MTLEPQNPNSPVSEETTACAPEEAMTSVAEEGESREGICPYFTRERSHGVVTCECARLKFPDRKSRREVVYRYCAHPEGYKDCMLKQALDHYYERKYAKHEQE